jgi:uncharacterized protein
LIICDTAPLVAAAHFRDPGYARMVVLVEQYADLPLGTSDASAVALAERLDITEVATLDRRHFTMVRPRHAPTLTLLPEPGRRP